MHPWIGAVKSLKFNVVLGISSVDCCIGGLFPSKHKLVSWQSPPFSILLSLWMVRLRISAISALSLESAPSSKWGALDHDKEEEAFYHFRGSHQVKILPFMRAAVSVIFNGRSPARRIAAQYHSKKIFDKCKGNDRYTSRGSPDDGFWMAHCTAHILSCAPTLLIFSEL